MSGGDPDELSLELGGTRLRAVRRADAGALFPQIHARPEVARWLCWAGPTSVSDLEDRYGGWRLDTESGPIYVLAIVDVATDEPIGEGTIRFDGRATVGDLGFWLGEAHHGRGHGGRTVELLVRAGFEHCGATVLTASVKEGNERSLRVLERAGFVRERAPGAACPDSCATDGPPAVGDDRIAWIHSLTRRAWAKRA